MLVELKGCQFWVNSPTEALVGGNDSPPDRCVFQSCGGGIEKNGVTSQL